MLRKTVNYLVVLIAIAVGFGAMFGEVDRPSPRDSRVTKCKVEHRDGPTLHFAVCEAEISSDCDIG